MKTYCLVIVSLLLALVLEIIPLPHSIAWLRPCWAMIFLVVWTIQAPHIVNVGFAFVVGLLLDVLLGSVLGEHAFVLVVITYLVSHFSARLRLFPLMQQCITLFFLSILYWALIFCLQAMVGEPIPSLLYWLSSLTTVVVWPLVIWLHDRYFFHFQRHYS